MRKDPRILDGGISNEQLMRIKKVEVKETAFERWFDKNRDELIMQWANDHGDEYHTSDDLITKEEDGTIMEWAKDIYNVRKKITKFSSSGTFLQGYLDTSYDNIVRVLGPPEDILDEKVQVEWAFKHKGVPVTIYDYKSYKTPHKNRDWHIGGYDKKAVTAIKKIFPRSKVRG